MLRILLPVVLIVATASTIIAQHREPAVEPIRVKVYPHPATTFLAIRLQSPQAATIEITVRSAIGNKLAVGKTYLDDYEVRLNVQHLPTGYYFVAIRHEETGWRTTYRFLKR